MQVIQRTDFWDKISQVVFRPRLLCSKRLHICSDYALNFHDDRRKLLSAPLDQSFFGGESIKLIQMALTGRKSAGENGLKTTKSKQFTFMRMRMKKMALEDRHREKQNRFSVERLVFCAESIHMSNYFSQALFCRLSAWIDLMGSHIYSGSFLQTDFLAFI